MCAKEEKEPTNMSDKRKVNLSEKLKNKEYRDAYVSSSVDVGVAFQVRALRKQHHYTQNELSEISGMAQGRISALENPSNSHTIATLKTIANALDVGLIVRFVPISKLVKWQLNLSTDSLDVMKYDEDPYFKEGGGDIEITADLMQYQLPLEDASSNIVIDINDFKNILASQKEDHSLVTSDTNSSAYSFVA
jgi:transcriptional regulator with XRE-family HTH domain